MPATHVSELEQIETLFDAETEPKCEMGDCSHPAKWIWRIKCGTCGHVSSLLCQACHISNVRVLSSGYLGHYPCGTSITRSDVNFRPL